MIAVTSSHSRIRYLSQDISDFRYLALLLLYCAEELLDAVSQQLFNFLLQERPNRLVELILFLLHLFCLGDLILFQVLKKVSKLELLLALIPLDLQHFFDSSDESLLGLEFFSFLHERLNLR